MLYIVILYSTLYVSSFIQAFRVNSCKPKMFSLVIRITDFISLNTTKTRVKFAAFNKGVFHLEENCFV